GRLFGHGCEGSHVEGGREGRARGDRPTVALRPPPGQWERQVADTQAAQRGGLRHPHRSACSLPSTLPADPATVQSAGARSPASLRSPGGARPMTPSTARGAALCLLRLCPIQAPAGAQLTPPPLPPDLAFSGAAGAAAADTASADALGAVGERAGDHAGTGRPDASEAARLLGETAFGAVGSLVGGSIGAFAAAATFDVACDDGRWSCATGTFLVFAGLGIGSTLGSGL